MRGTDDREVLLAALPVGAAIGLFGVIYGAAAGPLFGGGLTVASSALVFSGAVQFTVAGLAASGASPLALVAAAALVNSRNLVLGGILRPHLQLPPPRRAVYGWFLIDEVVGLALVRRRQVGRTLLSAGMLAYVLWLAGTAIGVAGGGVLPGVASIAGALFPILFVTLAAMSVGSRSLALRALTAAALTAALAAGWPAGRALAPVVAAVLAALPPPRAGSRHDPERALGEEKR